jgi:hypothetical protein
MQRSTLLLVGCVLVGAMPLPARAQCGNGTLEVGEECDAGPDVAGDCCTGTCLRAAAGTVCRNQAGACDVAEECDGVGDLCPADAGQADGTACNAIPGTCEDGLCQAGVCVAPSVCMVPITLTRVRIQADRVDRVGPDGSIVIRGTFPTAPPGDVFGVGGGVAVRVTDGSGIDKIEAWVPEDCVTFAKGGVRCRVDVPGRRAKARFGWPLDGSTWSFTMRLKRLDLQVPFAAPVTTEITTYSGVDRFGSITACVTADSGALNCSPKFAS